MTTIEAMRYVNENKLHSEANKLANKVGSIYMACLMLYKNVPLTEDNIEYAKNVVDKRKELAEKAFRDYIDSIWN